MDCIIAMAHRRMSRKAGRKSKKSQRTSKNMGKSMRRLSKRGGLKRGGLSRRVKKGGRKSTEVNCNKWHNECTAQNPQDIRNQSSSQ